MAAPQRRRTRLGALLRLLAERLGSGGEHAGTGRVWSGIRTPPDSPLDSADSVEKPVMMSHKKKKEYRLEPARLLITVRRRAGILRSVITGRLDERRRSSAAGRPCESTSYSARAGFLPQILLLASSSTTIRGGREVAGAGRLVAVAADVARALVSGQASMSRLRNRHGGRPVRGISGLYQPTPSEVYLEILEYSSGSGTLLHRALAYSLPLFRGL